MCREYIGLMFALTVKKGLRRGQKTIEVNNERITPEDFSLFSCI